MRLEWSVENEELIITLLSDDPDGEGRGCIESVIHIPLSVLKVTEQQRGGA